MKEKCYLGIDIGSISTKGVIINSDNEILYSDYIWTEGNPIDAVKRLLNSLKSSFDNNKYEVVSIGTTGSARRLIGTILNASVIKNEITAHAIGTTSLYPDVKTILEIGGQDSKIILIEDKIVIGVVGRFSCQKNPYFLVKCFAELRKIEPKAFLLWVGDGELKNNVEKKLYDMGLERDVQFVGRKPNVQEWYSAMDLFFLPSVFEGMGIVFLEAQCTGLPCVGSSNVPIETEITELMHRISLKDNEKIWAIQMKKILDESINRKTRDKDFIDKEYTHDLTQNDLRDYYNYLLYKKEEN